MISIFSPLYNSFDDKTNDPNGPIRLQEGKGCDGVLQGLVDGPTGLIIAKIAGIKVELPRVLKSRLEPLMGQEVRIAFLLGKYHAVRLTRRPRS
jgi:hypothetical protein